MAEIIEHSPSSLADLLGVIEAFQNGREHAWYRGTGDAKFELTPTLGRRHKPTSPVMLNQIEKGISSTFAQRSPPFVERELTGEWRTLFFMQHYGIPTRLLDWSESPFVALYFALSSVKRGARGQPFNDVAFWMCDPVEWNRAALSHISYSGGILDEGCEEIKAYSPNMELEQRATVPVMIYGTHNSPRIVAQRGVFALFGKGGKSMQEIFRDGDFANSSLQKAVIPKVNIDNLLGSLFKNGFSDSTIFPDLFGLSLEIRRKFGYI